MKVTNRHSINCPCCEGAGAIGSPDPFEGSKMFMYCFFCDKTGQIYENDVRYLAVEAYWKQYNISQEKAKKAAMEAAKEEKKMLTNIKRKLTDSEMKLLIKKKGFID